jgi:hypothetical protein
VADFKLKAGTDYLPSYNWEIGMNDDLAYADRAGWETSVEMLTGGSAHDWDVFGGLEVGNQYDLDPMGEERAMTTFSKDDPKAKGHIGAAAAEGGAGMQDNANYVTTTGGKKMATGPQNYNAVGLSKKGAD